ncbi:MAG: hypothetical protein CME32_20105 [Gimesia sp.]|nr:hypothetical protein [Gimesia sp.]MCR9234390.1 STN domain-containing protein [bacterium]
MTVYKRRNIRCAALAILVGGMFVSGWSISLALGDKKPTKLVTSSADKNIAKKTTLKQSFYPALTAREENLEAALQAETEANFPEIPLDEVMTYFSELHNVPVVIQAQDLGAIGLTPAEPIDTRLKNITFENALEQILDPLNLTYVIDRDLILITSQAKADATFKTRVYPVGDLCQTDDDYQALIAAIQKANLGIWERSVKTSRAMNSAQNKKETANSEKDNGFFNIQGSVIVEVASPLPGGTSGGKHNPSSTHPNYTGTISAVPHSKSLVISQTYHTHKAIVELLTQLRKSRADQRGN